jgi:hypothetical protein
MVIDLKVDETYVTVVVIKDSGAPVTLFGKFEEEQYWW